MQGHASGTLQWHETLSAADPKAAQYHTTVRVIVSNIVMCIWGKVSHLGDQHLERWTIMTLRQW